MNQHTTAANAAPLDRFVSTTANVRSKPGKVVPLRDALTGTAFNSRARSLADKIRGTSDKDARNKLKKDLPGYTPSGTFNGRRATDSLTAYSRLVSLDFDDVPNITEALEALAADPYVVFAGRSVSGRGLVAIVAVDTPADKHKQAWQALVDYYATLGLQADPAAGDLARNRYFAPDPEAHFNNAALPYPAADAVAKAEAVREQQRAEARARRERDAAARPGSGLGGNAQISEAAIDAIKSRTIIHRLGQHLGLGRPHGALRGNYHCYNDAGHSNGDKNPSLHLFDTTDGGGYKCFGCGVTGNPVQLVMETTGRNFVDALEYLADFNGCTHILNEARQAAKPKPAKPRPAEATHKIERYVSELADAILSKAKAHPRLIVKAPTGAGKTHALIRAVAPGLSGKTLIVVPYIALADQLSQSYLIPVAAGDCSREDMQAAAAAKLAVCTFDRAKDLAGAFDTIVIDEAHELPGSEHYRRRAVRELTEILAETQRAILLSATPPELYRELGYELFEVTHKTPGTKQLYHIPAAGNMRATATELAAEQATKPDGLAVVRLNSRNGCDNMAAELQARGIQAHAIHRGNADESELLDGLKREEPVPADVQVVITTKIIEAGFSLYAPGRDVAMIWIPDTYVPSTLVQFAGRVRDCRSLATYAITNPGRATYANRPDSQKLYKWDAEFWSNWGTLHNNGATFVRNEMAGGAGASRLPSVRHSDTEALNVLIYSEQGECYVNTPYLMAKAESKALAGISDADFFAEVQRLDPRFNVQQIAAPSREAVTATAAGLQATAKATEAAEQALKDWLAAMLPGIFTALLYIAARNTHSRTLRGRLREHFGIEAKDMAADGTALMQDAAKAGHSTLKLKEQAEQFAAYAGTFADFGMRQSEIAHVLAPGATLAKPEGLDKLKRMLQKQASLARPKSIQSTAEVYDANAFVTNVQEGRTYRRAQLADIVNAARGPRAQLPEREAVRLAGELFEIKDVRPREQGSRERLKKVVRRRTFDTIAAEYGFDADAVRAQMCGETDAPAKVVPVPTNTPAKGDFGTKSRLSFLYKIGRVGTSPTQWQAADAADADPPGPPPF